MAEVITSAAMERLGRRSWERTRHHRLDGTPAEPWSKFRTAAVALLAKRYALPLSSSQHLTDRYGSRALDVASYLEKSPELARPVVAGEADLQVEFPYQRDHEMAVRKADHLLRRTRLGLFHPELLG
jgi:glycerol-3-phosphate dehydrogenase